MNCLHYTLVGGSDNYNEYYYLSKQIRPQLTPYGDATVKFSDLLGEVTVSLQMNLY